MSHPSYFIFDAYGTLFDLSGALKPATNQLGEQASAVLDRWRILQLEYAWLSALAENYIDFETATRNAFRDALASKSITDEELIEKLLEGFKNVSAYEDAKDTLRSLKSDGHKTAILSNGSPSILHAATQAAGLEAHLDEILSVDSVRTYKPAPKAYEIATKTFEIQPSNAYFISSNWWDVNGARNFGYDAIWIDRETYTWPPSLKHPNMTVKSLSALTKLI